MRTLQLSLAGTVIVVLLGGLSGAVAAQADPMAPAEVTGSISGKLLSHGESRPVDDVIVTAGWELANRWEASDPRLSGTTSELSTWHRYQPGFEVVSTTIVVENDGGRWVGTSTGMDGSGFFTDTAVLHGEGAYQGLTAYLIVEWEPPLATFVGAIFPGGVPSFPDLPAD